MNRRVFRTVILLLALVLAAMPVAAGDEGKPVKGVAGPAQGVVPSQAKPTSASARALATEEANEQAEANVPPPSSEHSKAETQRRKSLGQQPNLRTGGKEIHLDSTPTPLAPNVGTNFGGLGQNGWIPYDAAIAVGPSHVVVMTNSQWIVYDRAGSTVRTVTDFGAWWGTPAGTPFDPKCFYDAVGGRFVMLAVSQTTTGGNKAFYHLSISQTGDPTGNWYNYQFDATKDGANSTSNWADFPGLGYDDNALYITSNQFTFSGGGIFQYAKIRVLSKTQIYGGSAATFTDFVGAVLSNSDSTQAFTVQPARTLSSTASEYFLNTNSNSNNTVTLWRVNGAPASPSLVRQATYSIGSFTFPPDAPQQGSATLVATNDARMYDIVWRSGIIHAAFGEGFSGLAAARYLRLNTTTNTVLKDVTYTQPSVHYYFPAVTDDSAGNLYMIFSRSSSSEYPSVYQTGMTPADSAIQPSARVKAGAGPNTSGRWGDYSAIVNDPADSLAVVSYAGWGNTSNRWATWVTGMTFAGGTPTPTLVSVNPLSGTQGANVNVTLTGQNTNWVQGTSAIGISGSGVTASNVTVASATSMTATFNIAAGAATGTRNVTVTTGTEVTSAATFTVNALAAPTLASILPNVGLIGGSTNVLLTGTNFVPGNSNLVFNSAGITVTNLVVSSTQITATFSNTFTANTSRQVAVQTPGGTSNYVWFDIRPAPLLTSLTPNNGNPGASVNVTLNGMVFRAPLTINAGAGITVTNIVIADGTRMTATFNIAASTPGGPRSVTVTGPTGTSGAQTFTVNTGTPTLTGISPSSGDPGTTVPVTLTGTNFALNTTVNASGTGVTPTNVVVVNNTTITADFVIASGATGGSRNITVTTFAGTSGAQTFTVSGVTAITVTGLTFNPNPVTGGQPSTGTATLSGPAPVGGSLVLLTSNDTHAVVPSDVTVLAGQTSANFGVTTQVPGGQLSATITAALGSSSVQTVLTILPPILAPTLASVSPSSGTQNTTVPVTLSGTNFTAGATVGVSGTGVTPTNVVVVNSTTITASLVIALGATTGGRNVTVTTAGGTSNAVTFTVNALGVPTLASIVPNVGLLGGSTNVLLTGTNFVSGNSNLVFNSAGITVTNLVVVSSTQITATFSNTFTANTSRQVAVQTPGGTSNYVWFDIRPAPLLTSLTPNNGNPGASVNVTLNGMVFRAPLTINAGAGITVTNIVIADGTRMTAMFNIAPSAIPGPRTVTVIGPTGTSNSQTFTVN